MPAAESVRIEVGGARLSRERDSVAKYCSEDNSYTFSGVSCCDCDIRLGNLRFYELFTNGASDLAAQRSVVGKGRWAARKQVYYHARHHITSSSAVQCVVPLLIGSFALLHV